MTVRQIISLVAMTLALQANSQLNVGARAGVSWANIAVPQAEAWKSKPRLAPSFGLLLHVPVTKRFGMQPEVAFTSRGYGHEYSTVYGEQADLYVFDFIDANALMVLRIGQEPVRPHLLLGPSIGVMTGARVLYETNGSVSGGTVLDPVKLRLNRTLFGLCGGAGFTFSTGSSSLAIEGRYAYGISDIWNGLVFTDINGATIREAHGYDRTITVCLSWMMPAAKRAAQAQGDS